VVHSPPEMVDFIGVDIIYSKEPLPQLYTILSVKSFPVGSLLVKSFPDKSLSKSDQNGKLSTGKLFADKAVSETEKQIVILLQS
jgi:hypothetical protein